MDHESYLRCRNYSFVVKLLGHAVFVPIEKLTKKSTFLKVEDYAFWPPIIKSTKLNNKNDNISDVESSSENDGGAPMGKYIIIIIY